MFLRRLRQLAQIAFALGLTVLLGVWAEALERGAGPLAKSPPESLPTAASEAKKIVPAVARSESTTIPKPLTELDSAESRPLPSRKRDATGDIKRSGDALPGWGSSLGGLAVVIGLAVAAAWMLKRVQPAGTERLPAEVVESLGRAPLAGGQNLHLVRLGGKLLLLSVTAQGARTLSEITDPAEVARLSALCRPEPTRSQAPKLSSLPTGKEAPRV